MSFATLLSLRTRFMLLWLWPRLFDMRLRLRLRPRLFEMGLRLRPRLFEMRLWLRLRPWLFEMGLRLRLWPRLFEMGLWLRLRLRTGLDPRLHCLLGWHPRLDSFLRLWARFGRHSCRLRRFASGWLRHVLRRLPFDAGVRRGRGLRHLW